LSFIGKLSVNKLLLILVLIFLSGCEGIRVKQYRTGGGMLYVPATEFEETKVRARAEQECRAQNMMLNSISVNEKGDGTPLANTALGYRFYDFFCDRLPDPVQLNQVRTDKKEIKSEPIIAPTKITIEEAKDKCKTLGYKTGTEKFGTCVLELTR
jgi:hypothetical protein